MQWIAFNTLQCPLKVPKGVTDAQTFYTAHEWMPTLPNMLKAVHKNTNTYAKKGMPQVQTAEGSMQLMRAAVHTAQAWAAEQLPALLCN